MLSLMSHAMGFGFGFGFKLGLTLKVQGSESGVHFGVPRRSCPVIFKLEPWMDEQVLQRPPFPPPPFFLPTCFWYAAAHDALPPACL